MDLVDIDKVLDDLELNESTNNSSSVATTATSVAAEVTKNNCPTVIQQSNSSVNNKSLNLLDQHHNTVSCSSSSIPTSSSADEIDHNNQQQQQLQQHQQQLHQVSFEETNIVSNNLLQNNKNTDDDRIKNKKFVTVSNVFSSLDDYRRDVESLQKQQQDSFMNIGKSSSVDDKFEDINKKTTTTPTVIESKTTNNILTVKQHNTATNEDDDNTEDEPDVAFTSSSSITTSSPSSFSSGPSPGSPSESCSFVLGQDNKTSTNYKIDDNNKTDIQNTKRKTDNDDEDLKRDYVLSKHETADINEQQQQKHDDKQQQQQNESNNKESLELGLSSISSSYLYCENISSSLPCSSQDMKFDVLSSISTSQTSTTTTQNHDDFREISYEKDDENKGYDKKRKQQHYSDGNLNSDQFNRSSPPQSSNYLQKEQQQQQQQHQQKVVGFGSTMDEISDTELDSILQEIDNDFQMYYAPSSTQVTGTSSTTITGMTATVFDNNNESVDGTSEKSMTEEPGSKAPLSLSSSKSTKPDNSEIDGDENGKVSLSNIKKVDVSLIKSENNNDNDDNVIAAGGECSSQQYPQVISMEDENNLQNADSFSQASTIEFAELRLQTDFDADVNDEKSAMNVMPNYTTNTNTNSVQTVEPSVSSLLQVENEQSLKNPNDVNSNAPIKDDECKKDTATKLLINNNDQSSSVPSSAIPSQHLQRPNSLDLPSLMDVKMYLSSTAGQTPPASRLDDISLLSTSSSDDQQLSSSEQQQEQQTGTHDNINPSVSSIASNKQQLGKVPPFWIPDSEAPACMQCKQKFSLIKRRHHCRACGQVLCSVCCSQKAKLAFLGNAEARVCIQCSQILNERKANESNTSSADSNDSNLSQSSAAAAAGGGLTAASTAQPHRSPNPNNPMEYCSMISPYQQVGQHTPSSPISVMVPVGVLKREGAPKNARKDKNVIFSDGIRPGCDLTELDNSWDTTPTTNLSNKKISSNTGGSVSDNEFGMNSSSNTGGIGNRSGNSKQHQVQGGGCKRVQTPPAKANQRNAVNNRNQKSTLSCDENESYIPKELHNLPPICVTNKHEFELKDVQNNVQLIERLQNETLKFVIQRNFFIYVKIVKLKCCVNKTIINFTTQGMHNVGQDEIIILLEYDNSNKIPRDIFIHLNEIYNDANHGYPVRELGFSMPKSTIFLESREHGGFLYIRSTFQCLQEIHLPESPYLIGILIHRWEVPWAKIFPLRLMLRLGAEYRYYPSPHISIRGRNSVYAEIAQTIINFFADFRNYSYTLATIRGMYIHMEDRRTNILIPKNRYDQIIKALNNSSDHILALGGNFSKKADGHLVCIQHMEAHCSETHTYSTQAINIQGQARKVTGASFIVFNGALKTTSGLTGKCNIVEDGLMVQILPAKMQAVRNALKNMKDIDIICGPNDVDESQTEIVSIKWTANDTEFNTGVISPIDGKRMDGIPSIRVHLGLNYSDKNHIIRWTEVFIMQYDESMHSKDPIDISKVSERIAKSTSIALVSFLDLLAANGCLKIGLRATLHQENVCYEAGSKNSKLPPLYMNALDNKLIPVLHKQATSLDIDTPIILELIFHILNK